jgi:hypothetical protein
MNNKDNSSEIKKIIKYVMIPSFLYFGSIFLLSLISVVIGHGVFIGVVLHNFTIVLGLPAAAMLATFIVIIFEDSIIEIEIAIEKLGISIKGKTIKVFLWIMVFLTIAFSINLLR